MKLFFIFSLYIFFSFFLGLKIFFGFEKKKFSLGKINSKRKFLFFVFLKERIKTYRMKIVYLVGSSSPSSQEQIQEKMEEAQDSIKYYTQLVKDSQLSHATLDIISYCKRRVEYFEQEYKELQTRV